MSSKILQNALLAAGLLAGCAQSNLGTPPPKDGFYYPISVAAVERAGAKPVLYVASSNFDLRYNRGTVLAVDLDQMAEPPDGPVKDAVNPDTGWAFIDHFSGELALYTPKAPLTPTAQRLYVPTRYDYTLHTLDVDGAKISCPDGSQDCLGQGLKLQDPTDSNRRMVDPFGLSLSGSTLWVAHLHVSDNPPQTGENRISYLARLDLETPDSLQLFDLGLAPVQGIVQGPLGLYLAGRALGGTESDQSMALRSATLSDGKIDAVDLLTSETAITEARGVALSTDRTRLFVTTRSPSGLMVLDITPETGTTPAKARNTLVGFSQLPSGPAAMTVLSRPGKRDLVAISCTASNAVALYDDEAGETTGLVRGIQEPYGMAQVALPGNAAGRRLFVVSFGNHTVDVVDIPDLARPRTAQIVGRLGYGAHRPLGVDLPGANP